MSDTHGRGAYMLDSVLRAQPRAEVVFHLGDMCVDIADLRYEYPAKMFYIIRGNCDFYADFPDNVTVTLEGKRVFAAHGHLFGVKRGLGELYRQARAERADICLFGHTHVPHESYKDGMYLFNPGSLGAPRDGRPSTCGVIDIGGHGIVTTVVEL